MQDVSLTCDNNMLTMDGISSVRCFTVSPSSQLTIGTSAARSKSTSHTTSPPRPPPPHGTSGDWCTTACSSGYVSADEELPAAATPPTSIAFGSQTRQAVYSETSSLASPTQSHPNSPSCTPSPGFGFNGLDWASAVYDACASCFDDDVADVWSAVDLDSSDETWLESPNQSNQIFLFDENSPPEDCALGPASNFNSSSSPSSGTHSTLFQQMLADGILEHGVTVPRVKVKKEPIIDIESEGFAINSNRASKPSLSPRCSSQKSSRPSLDNSVTTVNLLTKAADSGLNRHLKHRSLLQQHHRQRKQNVRESSSRKSAKTQAKCRNSKTFPNDHNYTTRETSAACADSNCSATSPQQQAGTSRQWSSFLEYLLMTTRVHDPQAGSDAILANEYVYVAKSPKSSSLTSATVLGTGSYDDGDTVHWQLQPLCPETVLLKQLLLLNQQEQCRVAVANGEVDIGQVTSCAPIVFGINSFSLDCDLDFANLDNNVR
jgi:hypothetical protein